MNNKIKIFKTTFNIFILLAVLAICSYNMFAWYTGTDKTSVDGIGLDVTSNTRGNTFDLSNTDLTNENGKLLIQPGKYYILDYVFQYSESQNVSIYVRQDGLIFQDENTYEATTDTFVEYGRTTDDFNKLTSYFTDLSGNTTNTSDHVRYNTFSGMTVSEVNSDGDLRTVTDFLDTNGSDKVTAFLNSANPYDAIEVAAAFYTADEYTNFYPTDLDEPGSYTEGDTAMFAELKPKLNTFSYYGDYESDTDKKYIFNSEVPASEDESHIFMVYYYNPYIGPSIKEIIKNSSDVVISKRDYELLETANQDLCTFDYYVESSDSYEALLEATKLLSTTYYSTDSNFYMYENPIVGINFEF